MTQCAPAHVRRKNFDFPGFREFQRFAERDRDRVRLFARRTARAPDAKRSRGLPKFSFLHLRENRLFERLVHARIAEKRSLLRQQPLEQRFVLDARSTHVAKQLAATRPALLIEVLAHTRRKEALSRRIEQDRGALLDQDADIVELGLCERRVRDWMLFHARHASTLPSRRTWTPHYRCEPAGTGARASSTGSCDRPDCDRNCASASLSCSDSFTMFPTVEAVWRAPCVVWRVMPDMICIALAPPSVPRTCCFEASEIS